MPAEAGPSVAEKEQIAYESAQNDRSAEDAPHLQAARRRIIYSEDAALRYSQKDARFKRVYRKRQSRELSQELNSSRKVILLKL